MIEPNNYSNMGSDNKIIRWASIGVIGVCVVILLVIILLVSKRNTPEPDSPATKNPSLGQSTAPQQQGTDQAKSLTKEEINQILEQQSESDAITAPEVEKPLSNEEINQILNEESPADVAPEAAAESITPTEKPLSEEEIQSILDN